MLFRCFAVAAIGMLLGGSFVQADDKDAPQALSFKVKDIDGENVDLADYKGKVIVVVNVASKCGLTPHYEGLQAMYEKYGEKGLVVLGFPCNQFGRQEPGSEKEIKEFCSDKYSVTFPMFSKIEVNGKGQSGLYKYLTGLDLQPTGKGNISWNFEKFVIDREGNVIARFAPRTKPNDPGLVKTVETALAK